jgi:hypothetical protein
VKACPQCGAPTEAGQLVCVNCGTRLALRQRSPYTGPPRSALPVIVILLAVVVLGAGAFGFALSEITSDDDGQNAAADQGDRPAPAADRGEPQPTRQADTETTPPTETAPGAPQEQRRSPFLVWPDDVSAHTVVLVTTGDRPAARRVAEEAADAGLEAGLLRSDDYDLGSGLWIVFAGRFDSRDAAVRQAANLAERYPGAYAQFVSPR